jgi:lipoyl(octanoyl) transferase
MSETWHVWSHGVQDPAANMAWDEALLEAAALAARPLLRFYGWATPAATFGYSQRYADVATWTSLRPLLRRPTGGGLVPHATDWTYALILPPQHPWYALKAVESYRTVHDWLRRALARLGVDAQLAPETIATGPGQCFLGAEPSDVLWRSRKVAGAAQRRTRAGLLIQGSVQPPPFPFSRSVWEESLTQTPPWTAAVHWVPWSPHASLAERVDALIATKYGRAEFHQRR